MKPRMTRFLLAIAAPAVLLAAGCASRSRDTAWTPSPRVGWSDLTSAPVTPVHDGYALVAKTGSVGRFPASIGVTRLAIEERDSRRTPVLPGKPKNEFLTWNRAFDELMAVSSVFPVAQRDLGGAEAEPQHIVAAFRALHAELGLIYAMNSLSEHETEMIGVLYDSDTMTPLALIAAHAVSTLPESPDERDAADPWKHDSRALVREKFVEQCFRCVRELVLADKPERIDVPAGWIPSGPSRPVQWPPELGAP